jgi:hypothetical protein
MKLFLTFLFLVPYPALSAPKADRYWEIHLEPQFAHGRSVQYWRTHDEDTAIKVSDACGPQTNAFASADAKEGGWSLSGKYGNLDAKLDAEGKLVLTFEGKNFARGQRISKVECVEGVPTKINFVIVAPKERSFAANAVTGDALHLEAASYGALPTRRLPSPVAAVENSYHEELPNGDILECSATPEIPAAIRVLQNAPVFGSQTDLIWPGALFQGKSLAQGQFKALSIARAPGTLTIAGVTFATGAKSSTQIARMDEASTKQAVLELASQSVLGVESSLDFSTDEVFSNDHLAYLLGLDGRFINSFNGALTPKAGPKTVNVLATFRQGFFSASIGAPETKYSVFADGRNLKDPQNEMGQDNPPLIVTSVDYGRVIYLLISSSQFDSDSIIAALNSANDAKPDGRVVSRGKSYTFSQVLQGSQFAIFAQGGDTAETKQMKDQFLQSSNKFEAIKTILSQIKKVNITNIKQGAPIRYTMNYLSTRETASMGFSSAYYRKECTESKKTLSSFRLNINCIDDRAKVTLHGPNGDHTIFEGDGTPRSFNIDNFIPDSLSDKDFELEVQVYNIAGPSCLRFQVNRTPASSVDISAAGRWWVGWIGDYKVVVNRTTGRLDINKKWDYDWP